MNLKELSIEIESKNAKLVKAKLVYNKISKEVDELIKQIEDLENEQKEKVYKKEWKEMLGKYYHVWLYTISEQDKFKRCQYYHVLKVEDNLLEYEYINIDETSKNSDYITISKFDFIHERGYYKWTEITKKQYEEIIKSKNPKRLE